MVKPCDPGSRRLSQEHRESKAGRSAYIARSPLTEQQQQQSKVSKIKIKQKQKIGMFVMKPNTVLTLQQTLLKINCVVQIKVQFWRKRFLFSPVLCLLDIKEKLRKKTKEKYT